MPDYIRVILQRPTIFPGHLRYASANLDLVLPVHKHNSLLAELRSAALATIHERYPDQDWLHVFTDGSATAPFGRAGVGAFSDSFNLKEPLSAWSDNFDGEIYTIFMAFRAISTTPGLNIVIFIDSQAATLRLYLATIYSHQNLNSSVNNLSTHFFALEERLFSNGSHLIAVFMETNKPTSWPKRHQRCIHLAIRCLFETPSDFSGTNCDRREFPLLQTWLLEKPWSCLLDGQRRAQLSALSRVEGVACFRIITGHDYLQVHMFKIGLADSPLCPLCKSVPITGEHLSACPALLHVLSQDNCGVLLPAKATSALYWTAKRLMSKRTLEGVILKKNLEF
ncbi:hydroxysteroid dehydrogenase-like protein 1 [Trichonephila clavipes]|nr:hydroxysteroid dehydrogenase-like protein 1 [Trichonephila clavipes]